MIQTISKWILARRENARLIKLARQAFLAKYPDRYIVKWNIPPQRLPTGDFVVTVCWNDTRPPFRSWWRFTAGTYATTELADDEANALIEIPKWR